MNYSSIIKRPCKCGCGKPPDAGFEGFSKYCRPDLMEQKIKKQEERQRQAASAGRQNRKLKNEVGDDNWIEADRQHLIQDLDVVVSRVVRISAANEITGILNCYCCGKPVHWTLAQNSHFVPRSCMALRWDIRRNCRASCRYCNENLSGNLVEYEKNLELEQKGLPATLREESKEVHKWTRDEMKQLLIDLRAKLRIVESKFKTQ